MLTSVPLSALVPPKGNPRKTYDKKSLDGLAQSIKRDGVIQNLTVKPLSGGKYRVVAGQRRFLALQQLNKSGEIENSYKVPIRFNKKASDQDLDRLATVENVQREAMDPIDEAEAFAKLLGQGAKIADVSAETGVSAQIIGRRVALADLIPEVKEAVRAKRLPLSIAEVLTLASPQNQKRLLKELKRNPSIDARYLRSVVLDEKPSAALAVFALEKYQGTHTKDLFAEKDATYFDDTEQFMSLQREAVDNLAEQYRRSFAWVEIITEHTVSWWQYRQPKKKEPAGVVIHFAPTGRVEVRKSLVKQEVDQKATAGKKPKKAKARPAVSKATWRYSNAHKTLVLQMALMDDPRKAKEATAILLLQGGSGAAISLRPHEALRELAKQPSPFETYVLLDSCARKFLAKLGAHVDAGDDTPAWARLRTAGAEWKDVIAGVRALTNAELDALITFIVIMCFGTGHMEAAEPEDTFFASTAGDLSVRMRDVWTPDALFLSGLRKEELAMIAKDCGALAKQPRLADSSKRDLVAGLVAYFKRTADPGGQLDDHETKGRSWLPPCMLLTPITPETKA